MTADESGDFLQAWRHETIHRMGRRCFNWDYTARCIYEITVVLKDRRRDWLGRVRNRAENGPAQNRAENGPAQNQAENGPAQNLARGLGANSGRRGARDWFVEPTADGLAVVEALLEMPRHYPQVSILEWQLMPEHFHFIVFVRETLPKPLGALVRGFKAGAAKRWKNRAENGPAQNQAENGPAQNQAQNPAQNQARGRPEWGEGFVDVILWREGQLQCQLDYLADNPRRLAVKRADPTLFTCVKELAVKLPGCDSPAASAPSRFREGFFSALGNRFLLDRPLAQVQVSRRCFGYRRVAKPGGGLKIQRAADGAPVVAFTTPEFDARCDELLAAARHGLVLLSPCVSDGEREIARRALMAELPLVTMQNKGFARLQKPAGRHFDACSAGRLLMLAPAAWPYQPGEKPMTRFDATAMNRLCQWIAGEGAAEINYHGMRPANIDELARAAAKVE